MKKTLTTSIGRLRLLAFLEGFSLLVLVFIAVPLKYFGSNPSLVKTLGSDTRHPIPPLCDEYPPHRRRTTLDFPHHHR